MSIFLLKCVKKRKLVSHNHDSFEEFTGPNGIKNILCNMFILKECKSSKRLLRRRGMSLWTRTRHRLKRGRWLGWLGRTIW
jgi:hypothetical protein